MREPAVTYVRYAGLFLGAAVLAGLWLRAGLYHPPLVEGVVFTNLVHAHSHLAFYGWATMGLFGVVVALTDPPEWTRRWRRVHAHVVAALSAAAFVTFLRGGYSMASIAVSTGHVASWLVFVALAWPRSARGSDEARPLFRLALGFLAVAGAGTLAPLFVMVRGASSPWLDRFAIEVFLVPFVSGWLVLGSLAALYGVARRGRPGRVGLWAVGLGVVPSTLAFPPGSPPLEWLPFVGRLGLAAVGAGAGAMALVLAWRVYAARDPRVGRVGIRRVGLRRAGSGTALLAGVAITALLLKSGIDLAVAGGPALHLIHTHSMAVAYLHLALVGVVTAAVAGAGLRSAGREAPTAASGLYAVGLVLMVGPLAILGWPAALNVRLSLGAGVGPLLALSLAGGTLLVTGVLPIALTLGTLVPAAGMGEPIVSPGAATAERAAPRDTAARQG